MLVRVTYSSSVCSWRAGRSSRCRAPFGTARRPRTASRRSRAPPCATGTRTTRTPVRARNASSPRPPASAPLRCVHLYSSSLLCFSRPCVILLRSPLLPSPQRIRVLSLPLLVFPNRSIGQLKIDNRRLMREQMA